MNPSPSHPGGKARSLQQLSALPIPPFFVIDPGSSPENLENRARALGPSLAVRSSAAEEDGHEHSFAGQLESFLQVSPAEVEARVQEVRHSVHSERIQSYCREKGLPQPSEPAVIVQRMVDARVAGVAFAVDPVEGRWDRVLISAVPGLGDQLVDGQLDACTWRLDPQNRVVDRQIPEDGDAQLLSDAELASVANLVRTCTLKQGRPQDIEWAFDADQLYLLQSRAVTTMGKVDDPNGQLALWDNSNIAESYGGITTPMTATFAAMAYTEVYREFCKLMGVPRKVIESQEPVFRGLTGLQQGRMYYNLLNWYRLLACFPGFSVNRTFMEQMMGVREGLPESFLKEFHPASGWAGLRARSRFISSSVGLIYRLWELPRSVRRFHRRLDSALAATKLPLTAMSPDQLVASYRGLEAGLLKKWDAPLVNDFFAMIFFGLLRSLCKKWCGDEDGGLQNQLVMHLGEVISAEPARRIKHMAGLVRENPEWRQRLQSASAQEIEASLPDHPQMAKEVASYLETFSERCLEELKLESETLFEDPLPLYRAIAQMAGLPEREAANLEEQTIPPLPFLKNKIFAVVLRQAKARLRDRENLRFERTRVFGRVRRILLELGNRLATAGHLSQSRDIFYLTLEEALGFVEGQLPGSDLKSLVALRKQEFDHFRNLAPPPERFFTRGWVRGSVERDICQDSSPVEDENTEQRKGLGCCPGQVSGTVRVVRDPTGVKLAPGTILVAERTDPGWILLFPAATGLVVERGSLLSHSAIVSRELGLPCVVSVPGVTTWLKDGDEVEMDGRSGTVRKRGDGHE
jgi:rifampicin phosphotransferase